MDPRDVIADLRRGRTPDASAVEDFARGLADGRISDAQAGAFAMAVCLNGLGAPGAVALTRAMSDSGTVLAWDLPGPVIDKHSTGGIGDPVSLVLAPALAALGCFVPMISGRGLGHTGGTLDKLESIPGLATALDEAAFRAVVGQAGCAIVSASGRIAPADRRLYALRDETGTVDSIDLIVASILSKKLAAGLDALVLDVKTGSGAFMVTREDAEALARALVDTATGAGCPAVAVLSAMDQPLATSLGNALELIEVVATLRGAIETPLADVALAIGAELLVLAGRVRDVGTARSDLAATLSDGRAAERFSRMAAAMGARADVIDDPGTVLPRAPIQRPVPAPRAGRIAAMDGVALGRTVVRLGGGRRVAGDPIDPAVGLSAVARLDVVIERGAPLAMVHAADDADAERAILAVTQAITIDEAAEAIDRPWILGVVR